MALHGQQWRYSSSPEQANDSEAESAETESKPRGFELLPCNDSPSNSPRRSQGKPTKKCVVAMLVLTLLFVIMVMVATLVHNQGRGPQEKTAARIPNSTEPTAARGSEKPQKIHWMQLALDILSVPDCTQKLERAGLPCKNKTAYITPESNVLSPLRCVDDAHHENSTRNSNTCAADSDTFQLLGDAGRVRVTREGTYLLMAHITVRMAEAAQVHFGVAVNKEHLAYLCTVQSYGVSRKDQSIPYSDCSVQGLRHLNAGDEIWLFVSQGGVPLQSLYRSTFLQIALLGDGRMPS